MQGRAAPQNTNSPDTAKPKWRQHSQLLLGWPCIEMHSGVEWGAHQLFDHQVLHFVLHLPKTLSPRQVELIEEFDNLVAEARA
eukprot:3597074-Amphidinium_carterae.1